MIHKDGSCGVDGVGPPGLAPQKYETPHNHCFIGTRPAANGASPAPPALAPALAPSGRTKASPNATVSASVGGGGGHQQGGSQDDGGQASEAGGSGALAGTAEGATTGNAATAVAVAIAALRPYAVVDEVTEGSPAATAGVQV